MKLFSFLIIICFNVCFSQNQRFRIGDKLNGGKIAYLFEDGGYKSDKYIGIVCSDSIFRNHKWECTGTQVIPLNKLSTSSMIGCSFDNQELHLRNCKESIGQFCKDLIINNESGWLLPTSKELMLIFETYSKLNIPFEEGKYWTNVDANVNDAIIVNNQYLGGRNLFNLSTQSKDIKGNILPIKYISKAKIENLIIDSSQNIDRIVYGECKFNLDLNYTGGNGGFYDNTKVESKGVLGLSLTFPEGSLKNGFGSITGLVSGIPNKIGIAEFDIYFGSFRYIYRLQILDGKVDSLIINPLNNIENIEFGDYNLNLKMSYFGGNGGPFDDVKVNSTGVTGLTALISNGKFNIGSGEISFFIVGKPDKPGIAEFDLFLGGKRLIYFLEIMPIKPKITKLNCHEAKQFGSFETGVSIWPNEQVFLNSEEKIIKNVSIKIPYKGGNGIAYKSAEFNSSSISSEVTAVLESGTLNQGDGELLFTIKGKTPKTGTLIFPINFGEERGEILIDIKHNQWMSENLDVDKFRNGDTIFYAKTKEEWTRASQEQRPAFCYSDSIRMDNPTNGLPPKYIKCKLYNCYAVSDNRGLAPEGWHVASNLEWERLLSCMGYSYRKYMMKNLSQSFDSIAKEDKLKNETSLLKLRSKFGWGFKLNGNNESGFNAIPFGYGFKKLLSTGRTAGWWSIWKDGGVFCNSSENGLITIDKGYSSYVVFVGDEKRSSEFTFFCGISKEEFDRNPYDNAMAVRCVKD